MSSGCAVVGLHDIRPSSRTRVGRVATAPIRRSQNWPSPPHLAQLALEQLEPFRFLRVFLDTVQLLLKEHSRYELFHQRSPRDRNRQIPPDRGVQSSASITASATGKRPRDPQIFGCPLPPMRWKAAVFSPSQEQESARHT